MRWSPELKKTIRLRRLAAERQPNCGKGAWNSLGAAAGLNDAVKVCGQSRLFASNSEADAEAAGFGRPPQHWANARHA